MYFYTFEDRVLKPGISVLVQATGVIIPLGSACTGMAEKYFLPFDEENPPRVVDGTILEAEMEVVQMAHGPRHALRMPSSSKHSSEVIVSISNKNEGATRHSYRERSIFGARKSEHVLLASAVGAVMEERKPDSISKTYMGMLILMNPGDGVIVRPAGSDPSARHEHDILLCREVDGAVKLFAQNLAEYEKARKGTQFKPPAVSQEVPVLT